MEGQVKIRLRLSYMASMISSRNFEDIIAHMKCNISFSTVKLKGKGIRFIALYPLKCSHNLPSIAGLYTQKPFLYPEGYSRASGSLYSTQALSTALLMLGTHLAAG